MGDDFDERYMRLALRLAQKGAGRTSPNPMVGAVLVRGARIVARGYHRRAGEDHAEIVALKRAGKRARGATLYCNLEPCTHYGKTPPCTPTVIRSGISEAVIGMVDPNPRVSGSGIRRLRKAGIKVRVGLLESQCRKLNEAFLKYVTRGIPFVILKLAATLDGRIATATGDSRWVTGSVSRHLVHRLRNQVDAVLVGAETVIQDNPRLTCRLPGGRDPWRIVLDGRLRIPLTARLVRGRGREKTIVVTGNRAPSAKVRKLEGSGVRVWSYHLRRGIIPFRPVLRRLAGMGCLIVMIEGGGTTAALALGEKVVDKVYFFYAPKILGSGGRAMIESLGIKRMAQSRKVKDVEIKRYGDDMLVSGYLGHRID